MSSVTMACFCLCAAALPFPPGAVGLGRTETAAGRLRDEDRLAECHAMVRDQIAGRGLHDSRVLEAMRRVPRHRFVPAGQQAAAYDDNPLPIGNGQTISQPYIVAFMTEALGLEPGRRVLEIGTGSGYQAAVLAALTDQVYTVEIIPALAERSGRLFRELGLGTVRGRQGDGWFGWSEHAPYDAIIVTAAAGHIPPPLLSQLKPGGRMIIPVGGPFEVQVLVLVTKDADGAVERRQLLPVRFVPFTRAPE